MAEPLLLPDEASNRALVGRVHPPGWRNPEPSGRYDLVVLGAGTAGLVSAAGAAGLGAKVALVERHLMGGDCLNVGCVPSKALLRSARAAAAALDGARFGVGVSGVRADFPKAMERLRGLRAGLSPTDSAERFRGLGVDVFFGQAAFTGHDAVHVDGRELRFSKAVIATGARAAMLPIPGLQEAGALTNETVFSLTELPRRLLVVGAGPIGAELAQAFARLGSKVTLLEALHGFLPREDRDAAAIVEKALVRDGVEILCCVEIEKIEARGGAKAVAFKSKHGSEKTAEFDAILLGVGRAPNIEGLGLEAAGVAFDKSGVKVDDFLRTTNRRIYAAGDVCLPAKFTHMADASARIVIQNALFFGRKRVSALTVPWCTYTEPELAHAGLYEQQARDRGLETVTITQKLHEVDRAVLDGEEEGLLKVHLAKGSDKILGATLVADRAGDLISELIVAMSNGLGLKAVAAAIHPYPTQAEVFKKAADAYNRTRLTPAVRRLLSAVLRLGVRF